MISRRTLVNGIVASAVLPLPAPRPVAVHFVNQGGQWIAQSEALRALSQICGDLLFKNADFPGAEDLAKRLHRMVLPTVEQVRRAARALPSIVGDSPPSAIIYVDGPQDITYD